MDNENNNNKNVILLTVIAVATLLVAVVGATFAYFTVNNASGQANTTVTAKAEAVAAVTLSNPTGNVKLNVSAAEMSEENVKTYYAVKHDALENNTTTNTALPIARATVGEGEGTEKTQYTCTVDLTVAASGSMASVLKEGEAKIVFTGAANKTIDLSADQLSGNETVTATFNLDGTSQKTVDVNALVSLENKNSEQNHLAGQTLEVTITSGDFSCELKQ